MKDIQIYRVEFYDQDKKEEHPHIGDFGVILRFTYQNKEQYFPVQFDEKDREKSINELYGIAVKELNIYLGDL